MATEVEAYSASRKSAVICAVVYGLFLMCTSVLLWGGFLGVMPPQIDGAYRAASYFACAFAHPAGLFAVGAASYARPASREWRHPVVALALVVFAAGLLSFQVQTGFCSPLMGALTGGLLGLASALFFCVLQELVASLRVYVAGIVVFSAAAISAGAYLLIGVLPSSVSVWIVLFACFPLVAVLCVTAYRWSMQFRHPMFHASPSKNHGKLARAAVDLWRPLLCIAFSALLIGIIRADTIIDESALGDVNNSGMLGLLLASVVLLGCWRVIYARTLLSKLQLLIFPLIATSFLLLPFLTGESRGVFVSLAFTVFSNTSSLMVVTCARTARMYAIPPVLVFGVFSGVVYLALACGALLSYSFGGLSGASTLWLFAIALVAIYVLSMALTLGTRLTDGVRRSKAAEDVSRASATTDAFSNDSELLKTDEASGPSQADSVAASVGTTGLPKGFSDAARLDRQCAGVAKHYGLTARETEVMTLLAHGRDVAFIAEELTLSKNTVRTHTKGVFSKMGVHSKQELIDVVYLYEE